MALLVNTNTDPALSVLTYRHTLASLVVSAGTNVAVTGANGSTTISVPGPLVYTMSSANITQPIIQYGEAVANGTSGSVSVTLPVAYTNLAYNISVTLRDPAVTGTSLSVTRNTTSTFTIQYNIGVAGAHNVMWNTMGF
jgi:hypothetical protein